MTHEPATAVVTVHLLQLPVRLAARARQHFEELQREFVLLSAGDTHGHEVPARLLGLVDALTTRFAGVADDATVRLEAAIDRGDTVIEDHLLELPVEAAEGTRALGALMDEADEFCRTGAHLLTLATPEECVRYRHWYLGQVVGQLTGQPALSWPEFNRLRSA